MNVVLDFLKTLILGAIVLVIMLAFSFAILVGGLWSIFHPEVSLFILFLVMSCVLGYYIKMEYNIFKESKNFSDLWEKITKVEEK